MREYRTIFGERIRGEIINMYYQNIVIVEDENHLCHVVHRCDVFDHEQNQPKHFRLEVCQKYGQRPPSQNKRLEHVK